MAIDEDKRTATKQPRPFDRLHHRGDHLILLGEIGKVFDLGRIELAGVDIKAGAETIIYWLVNKRLNDAMLHIGL